MNYSNILDIHYFANIPMETLNHIKQFPHVGGHGYRWQELKYRTIDRFSGKKTKCETDIPSKQVFPF